MPIDKHNTIRALTEFLICECLVFFARQWNLPAKHTATMPPYTLWKFSIKNRPVVPCGRVM